LYSNVAAGTNHSGYGMLLDDRIVIAEVLMRVHGSYSEQTSPNTITTTTWSITRAPAAFVVGGGLLEGDRIVTKAFVAWTSGNSIRWNKQSREVWTRNEPAGGGS
jgi:hypothetical protein